MEYSKKVIANVTKQSSDQSTDYNKAQTELTKYKTEIETSKTKLESAQSQVETLKGQLGGILSKENKNLQEELNTLQNEQKIDNLKDFEKGLIAPFDGVSGELYGRRYRNRRYSDCNFFKS